MSAATVNRCHQLFLYSLRMAGTAALLLISTIFLSSPLCRNQPGQSLFSRPLQPLYQRVILPLGPHLAYFDDSFDFFISFVLVGQVRPGACNPSSSIVPVFRLAGGSASFLRAARCLRQRVSRTLSASCPGVLYTGLINCHRFTDTCWYVIPRWLGLVVWLWQHHFA